MKYRILRTSEYLKWFDDQPFGIQDRIDARIYKIEHEGFFGVINRFDGLVELKWGSGLRLYTAVIGNELVIILLGGNKNGQQKDIVKAKKILKAFIN